LYVDRITREFTHQDQLKNETAALRNRVKADIDDQLAIKLTDISTKRSMNFTLGDDQYRRILQLMLELEKKMESINDEVRSDFTVELQNVSKRDVD